MASRQYAWQSSKTTVLSRLSGVLYYTLHPPLIQLIVSFSFQLFRAGEWAVCQDDASIPYRDGARRTSLLFACSRCLCASPCKCLFWSHGELRGPHELLRTGGRLGIGGGLYYFRREEDTFADEV